MLDEESFAWQGYLYAILLFLTALIQSLCLQQYFSLCFQLGINVRASLIAAIYKKVGIALSSPLLASSKLGWGYQHPLPAPSPWGDRGVCPLLPGKTQGEPGFWDTHSALGTLGASSAWDLGAAAMCLTATRGRGSFLFRAVQHLGQLPLGFLHGDVSLPPASSGSWCAGSDDSIRGQQRGTRSKPRSSFSLAC